MERTTSSDIAKVRREMRDQLLEVMPIAINTLKEIIQKDDTPPHIVVRAANSLIIAEKSLKRLKEEE